ncbi:MAG: T9SS type A sorting domain-containing protein [Chitinophagaceae bacterium]
MSTAANLLIFVSMMVLYKKIIVLLFCFFPFYAFAQNISLDWVHTWGTTNAESSKLLCQDSENNLYLVGQFEGTVDFDPGIGIYNKTSNGGSDIYILKLDANGNFIWVQTFGNPSNNLFEYDIIEKAQVDASDNIIITGRFFNTVDFDPGSNTDLKTSNGLSDAYILKLDESGNYLWSYTFGGAGHETSRGLSINSDDEIFIAGRFLNTVDFDAGSSIVNETALGVDIYILKVSANGVFKWVKILKGPANNSTQVNDLICDNNNNILLNAHFKDSIDVDPSFNTNYLVDTNDPLQFDFFVLKLNPNGDFIWAKQVNNINGNAIGVSIFEKDSLNNYYLGGTFMGTVDFDLSSTVYQMAASKLCAFVCKMDSNANLIWAKQMGGTSGIAPEYETTLDIAIDAQGNVNLCGIFKGYEDFDPGPSTYYLGYIGDVQTIHGFTMQLDQAGNFNWAKNLGKDPYAATCNNIVVNSQGVLYITGEFFGTTDFDFNAGTHNLTAQGGWDAYLLKTKNCALQNSTDIINSCEAIQWINGNTYSVSNFWATDTFSTVDGCDSVVTLNLTITPMDTSINKLGNTLTATISGAGVSYQWVDCNSNYTALFGETNQSFTPTINGSYAVIITIGNCKDTSMCYDLKPLAVHNYNPFNIHVFPNPSKGDILISNDGKGYELKCFNTIGQNVYSSSIEKGEKEKKINLGALSTGLYTYIILHNEQIVLRDKIVLE